MQGFIIRHNAIVIYTFYIVLALNLIPSHLIDRLLYVPALTHKQVAAVAPEPYHYDTHAFDALVLPEVPEGR